MRCQKSQSVEQQATFRILWRFNDVIIMSFNHFLNLISCLWSFKYLFILTLLQSTDSIELLKFTVQFTRHTSSFFANCRKVPNYVDETVMLVTLSWWRKVGDAKLVTIFGCWKQNLDVGSIFWMLVPDVNVKR